MKKLIYLSAVVAVMTATSAAQAACVTKRVGFSITQECTQTGSGTGSQNQSSVNNVNFSLGSLDSLLRRPSSSVPAPAPVQQAPVQSSMPSFNFSNFSSMFSWMR